MQLAAVLASSELAGQTAWKQEFKRMKRLESVGITWPKVLVLVFLCFLQVCSRASIPR